MPDNIIFITSDEHQSTAMGCAGNPFVDTPNLDAMAAEGTRFDRMYCQGPLCTPSRTSLLTGRYVHEHRVGWNGVGLDPTFPTVPEALQAQGYNTGLIGKAHFSVKGPMAGSPAWHERFGFDHSMVEGDKYGHTPDATTPYSGYLREKGLLDRYAEQVRELGWLGPRGWDGETSVISQGDDLTSFIGDHAIDWLQTYDEDRPFFLWVSFVAPHPPFLSDPDWWERYRDAEVPLPAVRDVPDARGAWADYLQLLAKHGAAGRSSDDDVIRSTRHYYAMISLIDAYIGRIAATVRARGWDDRTWLMYTSDHGEMLGSHGLWGKNVFYKPSVLIPAIVRPPGGGAPATERRPVESIDFPATFLEIAGEQRLRETLPGRSLIDRSPRDHVLSQLGVEGIGHDVVMIADDRHRYTYDRLRGEACELFDLTADPDERHNLMHDPASAAVRDILHDELCARIHGPKTR